MPAAGLSAPTRRAVAELLGEARARTLMLVSSLTDEEIRRRPGSDLESVLSELYRIVQYEAHWLLDESLPQYGESYDEWFDAMTDLRQRVLLRLEELDAGHPALAERCRMVLEHEYHRGEAILETLQSLGDPYNFAQQRTLPKGRRLADPGIMVRFPGGSILIGAAEDLVVWSEEKPLHPVSVQPFWIDVLPVTNGDFMTFMGEGGYEAREIWSEDGWQWLKATQNRMPEHWSWQDGVWWCRSMGRDSPLDLTCPVTHISQHEAEAFARFVGKRLPTEIEWEAAAAWDPECQARRAYPWGKMPPSPHVANLDQLGLGPASVGAFPGNISPIGCYGMVGDVWEWTSSEFLPYPGAQESNASLAEGCYGRGHKVLKGGSWATRPGAIRSSSRRHAAPETRHIFSGFRCARDG